MHKIIIADDSENWRDIYERCFEIKGFDAETVPSGERLIEKVKSGNYNLAITDNDMGDGITGIKVVSEIRKFNSAIPLFVYSGTKGIEKLCLEAGATGFIDKSNGVGYLFEKIEPYLK